MKDGCGGGKTAHLTRARRQREGAHDIEAPPSSFILAGHPVYEGCYFLHLE